MNDFTALSQAAVVVPLYQESMTSDEELSFKTTLDLLNKHDIHVICPVRLRGYISTLKNETDDAFEVQYFPNKCFSSIIEYNRLMMSLNFYQRFERYEYILIVQTDALVLSDQLTYWCNHNYSFIGAPWFVGWEAPVSPLAFLGVGNGGFSLRKVKDAIRVLSSVRYIPRIRPFEVSFKNVLSFLRHSVLFAYSVPPLQPKINEDVFWGILVPKSCNFFTVPTPEQAIPFCFEVKPEYLFEKNGLVLPFGCHAWKKYNIAFWKEKLVEQSDVFRGTLKNPDIQ